MGTFGHYDDDGDVDTLNGFADLLGHAFLGMLIRPITAGERLARWSAIPCVLLPIAVGLLIYLVGYHAWMLGFLVVGGLLWICYTGWVCTRLERAYHRYLREAEEDPEITLADFNRRKG